MGVNLYKLRKNKNLTQAELGEKCGVSQQMIALIEIGERNPSVETAKKISAVLEFDWTKFFEE